MRKFIADSRTRLSVRRARISAAPPFSWRQFKADMREPASVPRVILNLGVPFVLLALFLAAAKYRDWITHQFSPGWLFVTILAASFGLFYVRRFFRLGYGILEFLLGVAIVGDTIFGPAPEPSKLDEPMIKIAAGMYLAIRGIDNCMHWLTPRLGGAPPWVRWILRSE